MIGHVTPHPWTGGLVHESYGAPDTYRLAAKWLQSCGTVADWGGAGGAFGHYLPPSVRYVVVDGTAQGTPGQVLADLSTYRQASDGILIRHALELNHNWRAILWNALVSFSQRMVVVTFTGDDHETRIVKRKSGWPIHAFNPDDLRREMGALLVRDETVTTTHPERIYYLERRP